VNVSEAGPAGCCASDAHDAPPAVRLTDLSLRIDDKPILEQIRLEVPAGQMVALLGHNGAGKSSLLKVLASLARPSAGRMELFGAVVRIGTGQGRARIGLISHQPILYRDLSPRENLDFFGRLYDCDDPAARATQLLERVGMTDRADDPVRTLSRGMVQRVSIARALMHDPGLLLADEPFAGLDAASVATLESLLTGLGRAGRTVIMANHDVRQSLDLADQVVVLRRGRVVLDRPAEAVDAQIVLREITAP